LRQILATHKGTLRAAPGDGEEIRQAVQGDLRDPPSAHGASTGRAEGTHWIRGPEKITPSRAGLNRVKTPQIVSPRTFRRRHGLLRSSACPERPGQLGFFLPSKHAPH